MIAPTVGRNLLFRPSKGDQLSVGLPEGESLMAFIAAVLAPDRLNLCVLSWKGHATAVRNVMLVQAGETPPEGASYAHWMDYQLGQAAKTEALQAALASGSTGITVPGHSGAGAEQSAANPVNPAPSSLQIGDAAAAAVAVAPRVGLADIEARIQHEYYTTADKAVGGDVPVSVGLGLMTLCILEMRNGFIVVGTSAPASVENFNPELGRKFARENAIRQLWPLMGFALRDKLAAA